MMKDVSKLTIRQGVEPHIVSRTIRKDEATEHVVRMDMPSRSSVIGGTHANTT